MELSKGDRKWGERTKIFSASEVWEASIGQLYWDQLNPVIFLSTRIDFTGDMRAWWNTTNYKKGCAQTMSSEWPRNQQMSLPHPGSIQNALTSNRRGGAIALSTDSPNTYLTERRTIPVIKDLSQSSTRDGKKQKTQKAVLNSGTCTSMSKLNRRFLQWCIWEGVIKRSSKNNFKSSLVLIEVFLTSDSARKLWALVH